MKNLENSKLAKTRCVTASISHVRICGDSLLPSCARSANRYLGHLTYSVACASTGFAVSSSSSGRFIDPQADDRSIVIVVFLPYL